MNSNLFSLPTKAGILYSYGGLQNAGLSWAVSQIYTGQNHSAPLAVITEDSRQAEQLGKEIAFFLPNAIIRTFPDWETLPYDQFSPHQDIISERLATLFQLPRMHGDILIVPIASVLQKLVPKNTLHGRCFFYKKGDLFNLKETREQLSQAGYLFVKQVYSQGEFSIRGSLIDIFPTDAALPIRLDLFDDEIESIRVFDPESQKSVRVIDTVEIMPAKEYALNESAKQLFKEQYLRTFPKMDQKAALIEQVSKGTAPAGIEYFLPLFYPSMDCLFDYLPESSRLVCIGNTEQAIDNAENFIQERYALLNNNPVYPLLPPNALFLKKNEVFQHFKHYPRIKLLAQTTKQGQGHRNINIQPLPDLAFEHRKKDPAERLKNHIAHSHDKILITAHSEGRKEHLDMLLQRHGIQATSVDGWLAFTQSTQTLHLTSAPLDQSLKNNQAGFTIVTEETLLGKQISVQRSADTERPIDPETVLSNLTELVIDAPVVHETHGVGRYKGMERITVQETAPEFLVIAYAKGDKLYVPIADLHLIHRYTGADGDRTPLHKLGGEEWRRLKKRANERIRDVATELLDIYAKRNLKKGHAFLEPDNDFSDFCESFPFEETPDQLKAIQEIIQDMTSERSMDRLVCGDVGFGKTEVAMRAAFLAANGGKQVAVLVPTTLLAQQHYENFCDRFSNWPFRIELISRFGTKKENDGIIAALDEGKVDIVIGTHKLLQKSVAFKTLGLFILDEEHRFGVRQKEHLKTLRHEVDMLSLTATPIPRTLNMSLSGIRDLSLIATPPARRHTINTTVCEWNDDTIQDACLRELHRGGQVYFLHNEVKTITSAVNNLKTLLPEAQINYAHGQMREMELEKVMRDFYHQRFNILVCTTIIESGIDNPNANTILINRADKLGLSQLYQIRGRVGRSHHQAYAYLIRPPLSQITRDAEKRLEAIGSIHDLGAGFVLATHDLEIRGAGELLGEEQSGQINAIGFSLYSQLLDRTIESLRNGHIAEDSLSATQGTEVVLSIPAVFPEHYIDDPHLRLVLYKRIANSQTVRQLDEIQIELIDRFGLLPDPAKNLFKAHEARIMATPLGIQSIDIGSSAVSIQFIEQPKINTDRLIQILQSEPDKFRFDGQNCLNATVDEENESALSLLTQLLDTLRPNPQEA